MIIIVATSYYYAYSLFVCVYITNVLCLEFSFLYSSVVFVKRAKVIVIRVKQPHYIV